MKGLHFVCVFSVLISSFVIGQTNPVPLMNQPLVPMTAVPGGLGFTLAVNGTGFVASSVVNWNGSTLATTFVNQSQLTATVPAANIESAGSASVTDRLEHGQIHETNLARPTRAENGKPARLAKSADHAAGQE